MGISARVLSPLASGPAAEGTVPRPPPPHWHQLPAAFQPHTHITCGVHGQFQSGRTSIGCGKIVVVTITLVTTKLSEVWKYLLGWGPEEETLEKQTQIHVHM